MKNLDLLKKKLATYATDFNESFDSTGNSVASPLGVWMLFASILTSSSEVSHVASKRDLAFKVLGMDLNQAESLLKNLLKAEGVSYVSQGWVNPEHVGLFTSVDEWVATQDIVPTDVKLPTQDELDSWADTHSHGLIPKFPLEVNARTVLILANLIYAKFSWVTPFDVVESTAEESANLGVKNMLTTSTQVNKASLVSYDGRAFMRYAVKAEDGSFVNLYMSDNDDVDSVTFFEAMYLGDAGSTDFDLNETRFGETKKSYGSSDSTRFRTYAWEAESEVDLGVALDGILIDSAFAVFTSESDKEELEIEAKHKAVAKFNSEGFEAAALTGMNIMRASSMGQPVRVHELRFTDSFGYVVTTKDGIPTFSGMIHSATEADTKE